MSEKLIVLPVEVNFDIVFYLRLVGLEVNGGWREKENERENGER